MNISEIAKMAHVSTATVSRVLNQSGYVKKETKEKIMKIIEETGYQPNLVAKGLRTKQTHLIACLIPALDSSHVMDILKEMIPFFEKINYHMIISPYLRENQSSNLFLCAQELFHKGVEGIVLLANTASLEVERQLASLPIPIVCINSTWTKLCSVNQDSFQSGYLLCQHAIKKGYRNIGFYDSDVPMIHQMTLGIQKAMQEGNIKLNEKWILHAPFDQNHFEMSCDLGNQLLALDEKPDVFLAPEDRMALAMQTICLRQNVEIHFAGMGNTELVRTIPDELTTIDYHNDMLAQKVFELMSTRLENPSLAPETFIIPCRLIEGKSL